MKNIDKREQLIRVALGASIIGFGFMRKGALITAGLYPLVTGLLQYCPVKRALSEITEGQVSEMNELAVDGTDDSGGFRQGNPVTGEAGYNSIRV